MKLPDGGNEKQALSNDFAGFGIRKRNTGPYQAGNKKEDLGSL